MAAFVNVCIRCGKERIAGKKWEEVVGTSHITYVLNICPDKECQKIVESNLKDKKDHIEAIQAESLKRREANKLIRRNARKKPVVRH